MGLTWGERCVKTFTTNRRLICGCIPIRALDTQHHNLIKSFGWIIGLEMASIESESSMSMDAGHHSRIPFNFQAGLLVFASLYWGVYAKTGAPFVYHPDEPDLVGRAVNMIICGDLNPHWFHWPTLLTYLYAAVFKYVVISEKQWERYDKWGHKTYNAIRQLQLVHEWPETPMHHMDPRFRSLLLRKITDNGSIGKRARAHAR